MVELGLIYICFFSSALSIKETSIAQITEELERYVTLKSFVYFTYLTCILLTCFIIRIISGGLKARCNK